MTLRKGDYMNKNTLKEWMLSLQILMACISATTLVPLLVGFPPSTALFTAGLGTLLFGFITKNKIPAFLGSSFAFIAPMSAIVSQYGFEYSCGGFIVVGLIYMIFAFIVYKVGIEKVNKLLPPHITGAMIITIGLSLIPSAVTNIQTNIIVALITLSVSIGILILAKGFTKQLGILIALVIGYIVSMCLGIVDFTSIAQSEFIFIPKLVLPKLHKSVTLYFYWIC